MLQGFTLIQQGEVVVCLGGELGDLAEVELGEQLVLAREADEVVEALGVVERLDDLPHLRAVGDLGDLLGEDFGILGVEVEERVLDRLDIGSDLGLGLEEVGVTL